MKKIIIFLFAVALTVPCFARNWYVLELKIYRDDALSLFNAKNERNSVMVELPVDKDLFETVKVGDILQKNEVYRSAFSVIPSFFKTFYIKVLRKKVVKFDNYLEDPSDKLYILQLRSQKYETFSFNIKNERNAMFFEIPVDKKFYDKLRVGDDIANQEVYSSAFSIIPELFSEILVTVEKKRVVPKR
ncbi:MAG: hypothetical protein IJ019_06410 [Alphaproteobacteria bacterium]|nr:hypothetical protein [Alphaproteobacteria bacterium]